MDYPKLSLRKKVDVSEIDPDRTLDLSGILTGEDTFGRCNIRKSDHTMLLERRVSGSFENRAFFLSSDFDWIIGKDDCEHLVLIPLKKV